MILSLYDLEHNKIAGLRNYKNASVESVLSMGDKTLSFLWHSRNKQGIPLESYIQTETDEYVVKENSKTSNGYRKIVATLNLEDIEGVIWEVFQGEDLTAQEMADYALASSGWTCVSTVSEDKKRNISLKKVNSYAVFEKIVEVFACEVIWDSIRKIVYLKDKAGSDKGVYFIKGLNLKEVTDTADTYDFATRLIPIGADDLYITDVNDGKKYIENYQYSSKVKTVIWEDSNYTDAQALKEDAEYKLNEISKPKRTYQAKVYDLAKMKPEYSILEYVVGDTVTLIDNEENIREKQRITKTVEYIGNPQKNTCEISNTVLSFADMQKQLFAAAESIGNITTDNGTVKGSSVDSIDVTQIIGLDRYISEDMDELTVNKLNVLTEFYTPQALIGNMIVTNGTVTELTVTGKETVEESKITRLSVTSIEGTTAKFTTVEADNLTALIQKVDSLEADSITADYLSANYADITLANVQTQSIMNMFTEVGLIKDAVINNGHITGYLDAIMIDAGSIKTGTLDCAKLTVTNLDCASLTVGTINGQQIASGAIDVSKLGAELSNDLSQTASNAEQAIADALEAITAADEAMGVANSAKTNAATAQSTADTAKTNAATAQSTANTAKTNAANAQSTADTAKANAATAQEAAEAAQSTADTAKANAATAQSTANSKNTVFYQTSAPSTSGRKTNDIWFDTDDGNKMYYWNGSAWTVRQFGTNAIASFAITNALIADATIQSAKIANLDAAKITSGYISSSRIAANTITANKLAIADMMNYATVNENFSASNVPSSTFGGTAVSGGYIVKPTATNQYIMFCDYTPCNFKSGEQLYFEMDIKGAASGNVTFSCWGYSASKGFVSSFNGGTFAITTTEKTISGTITLGDGIESMVYFLIGINDGNSTRTQIYVRNVRVLRRQSGSLIVDGAITAGKIASNAVTAAKISAGAITASHIAANAIEAKHISAGIITGDMIASKTITADNIVAKSITADLIAAKTIGADQINVTDLFAQDITATGTISGLTLKGSKGEIGGFTIGTSSLYNGTTTLAGADNSVYLGLDGISCGTGFKVTKAGNVTATAGKIGAFYFTDTYIATNTTKLAATSYGVYVGTDGISCGTAFSVTNAGYLTSSSGKIGGFTIGSSYIASGTTTLAGASSSVYIGTDGISCGNTFKVTKAGVLTVTNGNSTFTMNSGLFSIATTTAYSAGLKISASSGAKVTEIYWGSLSIYSTGTGTPKVTMGYGTNNPYFRMSTSSYSSGTYGIEMTIESLSSASIIISSPSATAIDLTSSAATFSVPTTVSSLTATTLTATTLTATALTATTLSVKTFNVTATNTTSSGGKITLAAAPSYGNTAYMDVYGSTFRIFGNSTIGFTLNLSSNRIDMAGIVYCNNQLYVPNNSINSKGVYNKTTSSAANMFVGSGGWFHRSTSSSKRYKHDINTFPISELKCLYQLPICSFKYNAGYLSSEDERYNTDIPGIIVEDLEQLMPIAVNHENGLPEMWNNNILVPCILGLVQDLNNRVSILERLQEMIYALQFELEGAKAEIAYLKSAIE